MLRFRGRLVFRADIRVHENGSKWEDLASISNQTAENPIKIIQIRQK